MKKCTIIGHNGWTDYISQYALRRHFMEGYDECILFIDSHDKYSFMRCLYPEEYIDIKVPLTTSHYDGVNTCICCHTLGSPSMCPRTKQTCKFIDYSMYRDYTNIKLNAFDKYPVWEKHLYGKSFFTSMYSYYNLDPIDTIQKYKIPIHSQKNYQFLSALNLQEDFIAVHDNRSTGLYINVSSQMKLIKLDGITQNITDTIFLLLQAKEIHCIDSIYLFLIVILHIQYNLFNTTPVYVYMRSLDTDGPFFAIQKYLPTHWIQRKVSNE